MHWLHKFKWESDGQEKGYKSLLYWLNKNSLPGEVRPIDLFFIQKDHESHQYWIELVGRQVRILEGQILNLQNQLVGAVRDYDRLAKRLTEIEAAQSGNRS